ncbi:unnamed protein product, partial [Brassica rapa]
CVLYFSNNWTSLKTPSQFEKKISKAVVVSLSLISLFFFVIDVDGVRKFL